MSTETQILALFEEGNPIPDLDSLETIDLDAAAYLVTLTSRSSEVVQIEEKTKQQQKRPVGMWVAAIAVVLIGVALIIISQGGQDEVPPVTEPPPITTIPEAIEATTVPTPTTMIPNSAEDAWRDIPVCCSPSPRRYRTVSFSPEFSFASPGRWIVDPFDLLPGFGYFAIVPQEATTDAGVDTGIFVFRMEESSVDDQLARFANTEVFTTASSDEVTIGGATGRRLIVRPAQDMSLVSFAPAGLTGDTDHILYVLDVADATVLIAGGLGSSQVIDDIVESIVWKDLG